VTIWPSENTGPDVGQTCSAGKNFETYSERSNVNLLALYGLRDMDHVESLTLTLPRYIIIELNHTVVFTNFLCRSKFGSFYSILRVVALAQSRTHNQIRPYSCSRGRHMFPSFFSSLMYSLLPSTSYINSLPQLTTASKFQRLFCPSL